MPEWSMFGADGSAMTGKEFWSIAVSREHGFCFGNRGEM